MKDVYINQINYLRDEINRRVAQQFEAMLDNELSTKQVLLLESIRNGATSTKALADVLDVSTSAVSQQLNRLEDMGYIKREINRNNRREIMLTIATKGERYFDQLTTLKHTINRNLYGRLSLEELKQLTTILEKMNDVGGMR